MTEWTIAWWTQAEMERAASSIRGRCSIGAGNGVWILGRFVPSRSPGLMRRALRTGSA